MVVELLKLPSGLLALSRWILGDERHRYELGTNPMPVTPTVAECEGRRGARKSSADHKQDCQLEPKILTSHTETQTS